MHLLLWLIFRQMDINLCKSDKKVFHKIRGKETPRVHFYGKGDAANAYV